MKKREYEKLLLKKHQHRQSSRPSRKPKPKVKMIRIIKLPIFEYWNLAKKELKKDYWYWWATRAFIQGDTIFVMDIFSDNIKLVAHELGHWHGKDDIKWYPLTLMHRWGWLRLKVTEEEKKFVDEAESLIREGKK